MFNISHTQIICIDVQEKLARAIKNGEKIAHNNEQLIKAAQLLGINTIITEQYPQGLGSTVFDKGNFETFEKSSFSVFQIPGFAEKLKKPNILISGMETHICVLQSVMDLLDRGYSVYVLADCTGSREEYNHNIALDFMKQKGANIITLEIALFQFIKSSRHPNFKEIQALVK